MDDNLDKIMNNDNYNVFNILEFLTSKDIAKLSLTSRKYNLILKPETDIMKMLNIEKTNAYTTNKSYYHSINNAIKRNNITLHLELHAYNNLNFDIDKNNSVTSIKISVHFGDDSGEPKTFNNLKKLLEKFEKLKYLDLSNCGLNEVYIVKLFKEVFPTLKNLEILNLSNNPIGTSCGTKYGYGGNIVNEVNEFIQHSETIEKIDLSDCNICSKYVRLLNELNEDDILILEDNCTIENELTKLYGSDYENYLETAFGIGEEDYEDYLRC
jgi:hypothetical protein